MINPGAGDEQTLADITDRDARDTTHEDSPLLAADDAIIINSTGLSIEDVFRQMISIVKSKAN